MGSGRGRQPFEIISAFECGNHPPAAMEISQIAELFRDPGEICLIQIKLRQRVTEMRIEPGGDNQQFRRKGIHRRE